MRVTDDSDKIKNNYNPLIDTDIDIDAPYIDFTYVEDKSSIEVSTPGVYDTLFYNDTKILIVGEVAEVEIRFYSTENPNENYRTGQKHFKGKILNLLKCVDSESDSGYIIKVDTSKEYYGKVETVSVNKKYTTTCKARCIAILYFNDKGRIVDELVIPVKDWFSAKVYLNSAITLSETEKYPYKVGDIVDIVYYIKAEQTDDGKIKVKNADLTGRICDLKLTYRVVNVKDEDGVEWEREVYYNIIYIDASTLYNKKIVSIASTVIRSMVLHPIIPEV